MWDPQSDPLGLGVQGRYMQDRFNQVAQGLGQGAFLSGPLPDPQWGGWLQAVKESAPGMQVRFADEKTPRIATTAATDPDPYQEGPFGAFGAGTGGLQPTGRGMGGNMPTGTGGLQPPKKRLQAATSALNKAGGVPSSGPYDPTSQTT